MLRRSLLAIAVCAAVGQVMAGPPTYTVVSLTGQQVPGMPPGVTGASAGYPLINGAGVVSCVVYLTGAGIDPNNNVALLQGPINALAPLVRKGAAAPGFGAGFTLGDLGVSGLDEEGRIAVIGAVVGPGVTVANDRVIWAGAPAALALVAREGMIAAGTSFGVLYGDFYDLTNPQTLTFAGGRPVFMTRLTGAVSTSNDTGLWAGLSPALLSREGSLAPGTTSNFGPPTVCPINRFGQTLVYGTLVGAAGDAGLWSGSPANLMLIMRNGSPAPGLPGATILAINGRMLCEDGRIAVTATLSGAVTTGDDSACWLGTPGSLALVAREGDPAPGLGAGVLIGQISGLNANSLGRIVLTAQITGPGVTTADNRCVWTGTPGNLTLRVRSGQQAPGLPAGVVFSAFLGATEDHQGRVAMNTLLTGPGVTTSTNQCLYAINSLGELAALGRRGTALELAPGLVRTPTDVVTQLTNGEDGRTNCLNAGMLGIVLLGSDFFGGVVADIDSTCRPTVTQQPSGVTAAPGGTAVFTSAGAGGGVLSYRWRREGVELSDGGNISGAHTAQLTISPVGTGDAGGYDVVISNVCGGTASARATLTVSGACYANCDGSTGQPLLNVLDFVCFQSRFAAGEAYADCDQSGALNVLDFVCFQGAFAAGCR